MESHRVTFRSRAWKAGTSSRFRSIRVRSGLCYYFQTSVKQAAMAQIPTIQADDAAIEFQFARSSGPGGQNVNKVNTRATLLFDFENYPELTAYQRGTLRRKLATRLSRDGRLRVVSQRERTQAGNRRRAVARLNELLADALAVRTPRKKTKPSRASQRRRVEEKKRTGEKKRLRGRVRFDD